MKNDKTINGQLRSQCFYDWCVSQYLKKDNAAGDLAQDMRSDSRFPRTIAEKSVILNYLRRRGACEAAIKTFHRVWERYQEEVLRANGTE